MTQSQVRHHIAYTGWASGKLLAAVQALDEEQRHRDLGVSHKSLQGTLEHVFFADRIWCARAVDASVVGESFGEFKPGHTLETEWPLVQRRWAEWAEAATDDELLRVVEYKDLRGNPYRTPMWQVVLHVVNHATLHRGQLMGMLRQLGVKPPETDLIFYYRERKVD
jgi:uncharacterized damage-inducible protein DinB